MKNKHLWIITYDSSSEFKSVWEYRLIRKGWVVQWVDTVRQNDFFEFGGYLVAVQSILSGNSTVVPSIIVNDTWLTRRATWLWYWIFDDWIKSAESVSIDTYSRFNLLGDVYTYPEKSPLNGFKLISTWCFCIRNRDGAQMLEESIMQVVNCSKQLNTRNSQDMVRAIEMYLNHPKRPFYGYSGPWSKQNLERKAVTINMEYLLSQLLSAHVLSLHSVFPCRAKLGRTVDRFRNKWRALLNYYRSIGN